MHTARLDLPLAELESLRLPLRLLIPRTTAEAPSPALTRSGNLCSVQEIEIKIRGFAMNIEHIITKPITTPEYPDPTEARRYVDDEDGFYGYDYVFLEDATWRALCEIAAEQGCTVGQLCSHIRSCICTHQMQ
jgi:hypothetical protein